MKSKLVLMLLLAMVFQHRVFLFTRSKDRIS
jgi:hypothetical protein